MLRIRLTRGLVIQNLGIKLSQTVASMRKNIFHVKQCQLQLNPSFKRRKQYIFYLKDRVIIVFQTNLLSVCRYAEYCFHVMIRTNADVSANNGTNTSVGLIFTAKDILSL